MRALMVQWIAVLLVLSLAYPYFAFEKIAGLPWNNLVWAIGATALIFSILCKQAPWWWLIHFFFAPLLYFFLQLNLPPGWFLLAFLVLLLIFRGAASHQVPLFLTNARTLLALEKIVKEESVGKSSFTLMDLGAGIGTVALFLAQRFPDFRIEAVENSLFPYWVGKFRSRKFPNIHWRFGNFEKENLKEMHCVYAFLSPAPMVKLWVKVNKEMQKGAFFISNTFAVPEVTCENIVDENTKRPLFCYRIGG